MLLNSLYQKFITHTNLTDSLYKTIFIQLGEIFDNVNALKFLSLSYQVGDSKGDYTFDGKTDIPHYFVEMIKNLFERFYTLPSNSSIELKIQYHDQIYTVKSEGEEVFIPEPIKFITVFKLYEFFIINYRAEDFNTEFGKIEYLFLNMNKGIKPQVKELFDIFKKEETIDTTNTGENVDELQSEIEQLKRARMSSLSMLDDLTLSTEQLNTKKLDIEKHFNEHKTLSDNYQTTQFEIEALKGEYDGYTAKITELESTIAAIYNELLGNEYEITAELDFLREKKNKFEKLKEVTITNREQVSSFSSSLMVKLREYKLDMEKVKEYSAESLAKIVNELQQLLAQKDQYQGIIVSYENDIHLKTAALITKLNPKALTIDGPTLIAKLSNGQLSKSVNLVLNYIRTYYIHKAMTYDASFSKENIASDICQILASKKAFFEVFQLNIPYMFSFIDKSYAVHLNTTFIPSVRIG